MNNGYLEPYEVHQTAKELFSICDPTCRLWMDLPEQEKNTWLTKARVHMHNGYRKISMDEMVAKELFDCLDYFYNISFDLECSEKEGFIRLAQKQAKIALTKAQLIEKGRIK